MAPLNLSGAISAPRSPGHVLQQNRAVLCVWPHSRSSCGNPCGRLVGATSWKGSPPRSAKNVLQMLYLMAKFNVAKSGLISRLQVCLPFRPKPCPWDLESKNGPSSARVCPKGSGPRSAAKQAGSLCVAPLNHGQPMSAPSSRGHVLQQNRAVFCVWPH